MAPSVPAGNFSFALAIADPTTRAAVLQLQQDVNKLRGSTGAAAFDSAPSMRGYRITNVGDPTAAQDAATKSWAEARFSSAVMKVALQAGGANPLTIVGLSGATSVQSGTHQDRLATAATGVFYETDRNAIYLGVNGVWELFSAFYRDSLANRPADLTTDDGGTPGFLFKDKDIGLIWRWSGSVWHYFAGIIRDTYANRPTAVGGLVDGGVLFEATDMNGQTWFFDNTSGWILLEGWGGPTRGVIASITAGLGTNDAGYLYHATDYDRVYRWSGSAYADAAGQPKRGMYVNFEGAVPAGNGWLPANGVAQTQSTATGGTAAVTPNNVVNNYYRA